MAYIEEKEMKRGKYIGTEVRDLQSKIVFSFVYILVMCQKETGTPQCMFYPTSQLVLMGVPIASFLSQLDIRYYYTVPGGT